MEAVKRFRARPRSRPRGVALATALLLIMFLLVVGIGYLSLIERDLRFAGHQVQSSQAYYLAVSGLEYGRYHYPDLLANGPQDLTNWPGNQRLRVSVIPDRTITSEAIVMDLDGRRVLARRRLVAPKGKLAKAYDASN